MQQVTEVRLTIAAIIYAIEIDLKSAITQYITPFHSDINFIKSEDVKNKLTKRFKKDNPSVTLNESIDDVIEYLDFAEFYHVLLGNQPFLPPAVISELKDSLNDLEELTTIRNRVMHTRPLLGGDFSNAFEFGKAKLNNQSKLWQTLRLTLNKIESDPSFVLTISIPTIKLYENEAQHNLPIPDFDETGFIGRQNDVKDVLKLILGNNRVVSIIGDGGIGKTALALKVGYDIIDLGEQNPFDIVIWVSAKTSMLTASGVKEIKNALVDYGGIVESISMSIDDSGSTNDHLEMILEYMELFNVLLIIDNLETILNENIREFIRNASQLSKILITSRIGLGELEFRRPLNGLNEKESILLIRQLANLKKSTILNRLDHKKMINIAKQLHYNPLSLKWFVNSVETGRNPDEVLTNRDQLLDFCLSNVYGKLSENAIKIIQTILASRSNLNDAELIFTTELKSLILRQSLNELFSTTFISREIEYNGNEQTIKYSIPPFAKEYVLKNHPIDSKYVWEISEKIRRLKISTSKIKRISSYNEFGINAITIRNSNEKVVARLLQDSLSLSKKNEIKEALLKIEEAKSILPNYFEIYRISAFIKASSEDPLGAEVDYETGLDIEPDNPRLLYFYGSFLMNIPDVPKAYDFVEKLFKLRPNSAYPTLLFARILSASDEHDKAVEILLKLKKEQDQTKYIERIINTNLIGIYSFWGKVIIEKEGDIDLAISKFKDSITIYEESFFANNYDEKMTKAFCRTIIAFLKGIPRSHNMHNVDYFKKLFDVHNDQISLNQSLDYLIELLEYSTGVTINNEQNYTGAVVSLFRDKQFAFVSRNNARDLFASRSSFQPIEIFDDLSEGSVVEYEIGENSKGICAINLKFIE
ncbi:MAG: NB-ARC domain-containing protein [Flavobacteriales bacterium]